MSIESLKQQARKHEQNEEWQKALDLYSRALAELAREEQVDIGLHNRVGDLHVRVGGLGQAVEHYERAVELYREAYLPNNAIAVCKKILRHVPQHHRGYLVIGQIRAEQGFLPDARTNFLTYAERMAEEGALDESFRALVEFCDLAPDELGVRITVADQMSAQGREEDAVEQLVIAHRHSVQAGDGEQAEALKTKILAISPSIDVDAMAAGMPGDSLGAGREVMAEFGEIPLGGDALGSGAESELLISTSDAGEAAAGDTDEVAVDAGVGDFAMSEADAEDEGGAVELPMMDFDSLAEDEGGAVELPMMDFDSSAEDEGEAVELPMMDFDSSAEDEGEAVELPMMDFDSSAEDEGGAAELPGFDVEVVGDALESADVDAGALGEVDLTIAPSRASEAMESVVEEAVSPVEEPRIEGVPSVVPGVLDEQATDAEIETASTIPPTDPIGQAPVEEPAPVADGGDEGFVDLGAMILGSGEEKSTRFTVAYEEPSGDEEADFAKMLSQFKDKVSENIDSSDVRAHYDLGTAYKEMGLLDEAIGSFQAALRASADHLPTYELMGQTFMEMGQPEAAVKSLERAVEVATSVEDELVGIYYYLGRAYEDLENRQLAVEYYDRVFSLDINFADVTERLRALR